MTAPALQQYVQGDGTVSADNLNTFMQTCNNVAELRDFIGTEGMTVFVRGLETVNDGGGGEFYWAFGSTVDNGTSFIVPPGSTGFWARVATPIILPQVVTEGASTDLTATGGFIYVNKSVGSVTNLNLPAVPIANLPYVILDAKGDAATYPITVSGNGNLINGASSVVINTAYGNIKLIYNGSAWNNWT